MSEGLRITDINQVQAMRDGFLPSAKLQPRKPRRRQSQAPPVDVKVSTENSHVINGDRKLPPS